MAVPNWHVGDEQGLIEEPLRSRINPMPSMKTALLMAVHMFWQFALVVDSRPESTWLATTCLMALTSSSDSCNGLAENKQLRIGMKALSATGFIFPRPMQATPVCAVRHCVGRFSARTRGCQRCCSICDNPNYSPSGDEWHRVDHELPQGKDNGLFLLMRSSVLWHICPQQHMEGATAHSSRCEALLPPSPRARATMMASIIPPSNAGECQHQQAHYLYSSVPSYSSTAVCFFLDKNLPWWLIAWLQLLTRYPTPTSYYSKCV